MISKEEIEKFLHKESIVTKYVFQKEYDNYLGVKRNNIHIEDLIQKALKHFKNEEKENELLHSLVIKLDLIDKTLSDVYINTKPKDYLGCPG